jgi:hypothetical protein
MVDDEKRGAAGALALAVVVLALACSDDGRDARQAIKTRQRPAECIRAEPNMVLRSGDEYGWIESNGDAYRCPCAGGCIPAPE